MPKPEAGETLSSFVHRYAGSKEAQKSFPNRKQRVAIGYSEYRRKKRK